MWKIEPLARPTMRSPVVTVYQPLTLGFRISSSRPVTVVIVVPAGTWWNLSRARFARTHW